MANRSIAAGDIALHAVTLTPGQEDVITFPGVDPDGAVALIVHPGTTAPVYVSSGEVPAVVAGGKSRIVFPGAAAELTGPSGVLSGLTGSSTTPTKVRLISESAAVYSIEA